MDTSAFLDGLLLDLESTTTRRTVRDVHVFIGSIRSVLRREINSAVTEPIFKSGIVRILCMKGTKHLTFIDMGFGSTNSSKQRSCPTIASRSN